MKNEAYLVKQIRPIFEIIPGIVDFASIINNPTNEKDKKMFFKIEEIKDNKLDISVGLIINRNINLFTLEKEIYENLMFYFKKNKKWTLNKVNLFIKGAK